MNESTTQVQCGFCGNPINEAPDAKAEERNPCPKCGSTLRRFNVSITEQLTFHASLGFKAKRQGERKPHVEGKSGDDLHRETGRWMKKDRLIDRENDHYKEVVTDPESGNVIRYCEEPLSEHRGHGSAKKNPHDETKK